MKCRDARNINTIQDSGSITIVDPCIIFSTGLTSADKFLLHFESLYARWTYQSLHEKDFCHKRTIHISVLLPTLLQTPRQSRIPSQLKQNVFFCSCSGRCLYARLGLHLYGHLDNCYYNSPCNVNRRRRFYKLRKKCFQSIHQWINNCVCSNWWRRVFVLIYHSRTIMLQINTIRKHSFYHANAR